MLSTTRPTLRAACLLLLLAFTQFGCERSQAQVPSAEDAETKPPKRQAIPVDFPGTNYRGSEAKASFPEDSLTIIPELQEQLETYIADHGNPISAVVVAEVKTGNILAMAQGRSPTEWGGSTHTALHTGFPTASLFKTIVASAGFEIASLEADRPVGFAGGCADVNAQGIWMEQNRRVRPMTLHRAYGNSCNGFFAKIAINQIGLGTIVSVAKRFGWNGKQIPADFEIPVSPIKIPNPSTSSVHTVGRFAAGFGYVGTSAVHAAWQMLALANRGRAKPLRLFKATPDALGPTAESVVVSEETAAHVVGLMDATVLGGTASSAFRHSKYRKLRHLVGGKTGTLTGHSPKGLTTWFSGMMPLEDPEVVVASVVILEDLWRFKSANLAAEAFSAYADHVRDSHSVTSVGKRDPRL